MVLVNNSRHCECILDLHVCRYMVLLCFVYCFEVLFACACQYNIWSHCIFAVLLQLRQVENLHVANWPWYLSYGMWTAATYKTWTYLPDQDNIASAADTGMTCSFIGDTMLIVLGLLRALTVWLLYKVKSISKSCINSRCPNAISRLTCR